MLQFLLGFILSAAVGLLGYRSGSLSRSGVLGAILTGSLIFGLGGLVWGALLVLFFVSSSLLSHWKEAQKAAAAEKFSKGSRRDLGQALANGGVGAALAVGAWLAPHPAWLLAYVGAIAAVTADTWATEIGVLSRRPPRLITTLRPVPAGTSGGVTLLGTLAAFAGGVFIGVAAAALAAWTSRLPWLPAPGPMAGGVALALVGAVAGVGSALLDSLLGATVQRQYRCQVCGQITERPIHHGQPTLAVRGWPWLNNDAVNFVASLAGAAIGFLGRNL
ncbi:MAG: DUF92 domain-containing protein [Anaerolineae bacterium]